MLAKLRPTSRPRLGTALLLGFIGLLVGAQRSRAGQMAERALSDAWAEQALADEAAEQSYDSRFPLYGVAFHVVAQIMSEPSPNAEVLGYMRRGAHFRAAPGKPGRGCERTWHELASGGFVCAGRGFALGKAPEDFEGAPVQPSLYDALPYRYAKHLAALSLQYWRIPTRDEAQAATAEAAEALAEARAELEAARKAPAKAQQAALPPPGAVPGGATDTEPAPGIKLPDFVRMPMQAGFYVSVDREETDAERSFTRTIRGAYVDSRALAPVSLDAAPGVVLHGASDLPLGIAYRGPLKSYERDAASGSLRQTAELPRFSSFPLTGTSLDLERKQLALTRSGALVPEQFLRVIEPAVRPPIIPRRARRIHVNLERQTLVAYDGDRPVFATLVASGKAGYETPKGVFRIQSKHVSATMDGTAGNDEVYSIEDVPWTMYFQGSYALHAAFWHDRFGNPRSHGCVNLAPADARWLFRFTTPTLPADWHGVIATRDNPGTWISIE